MIPSANSTGDLTWHAAAADNWADHPAAAAAAVGAAAYSSASSAAADSRYHNLHRHQILDWENAMLLAHHDSVYDPVDDYSKPPNMPSMQADTISSLSHPRHYENLLSAHMHASSSNSLSSHNAWGLLNTVCSRSSASQLQPEATPSFLQTATGPYSYDSCLPEGAEGLIGYGNLAATGSFYADPLRSSNSTGGNMLGLSSFDQRRLDDIVKRELYTTHDFNSRLGLNLGGRTYFSADDFAFGRWGKRLRPNSPGLMQPAPLCQAEGCKADLSMAKHYHRRHKVCEYHSKAATVHIGDQTQRFCQQCSRFHVLAEFDDGKRSCRKRLADHNRRRRKPQPAPTLALEAATDAKDQSQEAPTGSESLQNGTQSSKGSPMQVAEDPPTTMSATVTAPAVSSTANVTEASSNKGQLHVAIEKEKSEHIKPGASSSCQSQPKSDGSCAVATSKSNMTPDLAGTSHMAANLSLGGTDILDMKPVAAAASTALSSHDGGHFDLLPSANKHAVGMPWLQGPKKHQSLQGFPYNISTKADHNVDIVGSADHLQYKEKVAESQSSSWMLKGMAGGMVQAEKNTLTMSSRHAGNCSNDTGGHELLRFLGEERELLSSSKQSAVMQGNPSSIGTLAFLDHSLAEPSSAFLRDAEHRMIQFSSLQQSGSTAAARADEAQVPVQGHSQLHRTPSKFIFGHHNHMI